jgi:hypothetical protein
MSNLPDVPAHASHEELVRAFMASIPKRKRERVEARFPVLREHDLRELRHEEAPWDPVLLDALEASNDGPVHHTPLKSEPSYVAVVVRRPVPARRP